MLSTKIVYVIDTASCTTQVSQNVATCLDQSYGHPQATRAHKTKTRNANFIFGQTEISVCYRNEYKQNFKTAKK
jgi:hypothetical protein